MSPYAMVMFPIIFFLLLGLIFNAVYTQGAIDNQTAIIQNSTWPVPGETWFGQTDFLGYFVATIGFFLEKVTAMFTLIGIALTPPSEVAAIFPLIIVLYAGLYIMLGVGIYKVIDPFAG